MFKPLVSVIIPVYNHARALEQSLITLKNQTYRPLECIIINDGSTDEIAKYIPGYIKLLMDAEIRVRYESQNNQGASAARNHGLAMSTGELVIFWDADTVAKPNMLERMVGELVTHPEKSFAYSRFKFGFKTMHSADFSPSLLRRANYIDTTSLVRRKDITKFDTALQRFQDWDFWLTLVEHGKQGIFVPEVLFSKIVRGRKGYSSWFPSFFLALPWKTKRVREYLAARKKIEDKHSIAPLS
jgi:glycosyltransferase involved in cell wall biosynthesis